MPAQNNTGGQADFRHATTVVAQAALASNRFVGYGGAHATSAGGANDCQGVSQNAAAINEAVALTTTYSELVEVSAAIALFDYIKPAVDGTGRAAVGTLLDHCGRALGVATTAGQLVEVQLKPHVHP
jgi:hypothetical protein